MGLNSFEMEYLEAKYIQCEITFIMHNTLTVWIKANRELAATEEERV